MEYMERNGIKYTTLEILHEELMEDPEFRKEWKKAQPSLKFEMVLIETRIFLKRLAEIFTTKVVEVYPARRNTFRSS
jgi:hypothetical protein